MLEQRSIIESAEAAMADLFELRFKPAWLQQAHALPFEALSPDEFEVLCFLLLLREHPDERVLYYGKTGDLGRDIVVLTKDGRVRFVQCKRYTSNVTRDDVLAELAKLATNLHRGRYPHDPSDVAWYIVPDLTNPAADLLEDQIAWRAAAPDSLFKHLGRAPGDDLKAFAEAWWPEFDRQHALA